MGGDGLKGDVCGFHGQISCGIWLVGCFRLLVED
jgi:hypothetical protein